MLFRLAVPVALAGLVSFAYGDDWQPASGPLMTQWAAEVSPRNARPEYPRPQMRREQWQNLNGLWEYAIVPVDAERPTKMDGKILVPFPVESALSGVGKMVGEQNRLWYRRTFVIPKDWRKGRVLLHFGAVDWHTKVWLNGQSLGEHKGGYDPFSFVITDTLTGEGEQELVVSVWDPTDAGTQPRGKQVRKPNGIWYTPVTGIWQTVWLEPVPKTFIRSLEVTPDVDAKQVRVEVDAPGLGPRDRVVVKCSGKAHDVRALAIGDGNFTLKVDQPQLWSPNDPFLYQLDATVQCADGSTDTVASYFAMRKIELGKDDAGVVRMMLNGKPLFQLGMLDQGYWPDGLYTAPTHEAMVYDIKMTKQLGFNMIRKHVKVEPATWYHECDKRGLLVWQDMPSGDEHTNPIRTGPDIVRSEASRRQFEAEWTSIIRANGHFPSIIMWVPFNEGWGQFDTARIVELTKKLDPTRLVNNASGWVDRGVGDVHDVHVYPGPEMPPLSSNRAAVLGEFGGLGLPLEGHTWQSRDNWGYRSFDSQESLTAAYKQVMEKLGPLIGKGLCAAVYTQTTDVEIEVNGLLTYDRNVLKAPLDEIVEAHRRLFLLAPNR
jgi:beta-galactosidase/beta-glucuronidase